MLKLMHLFFALEQIIVLIYPMLFFLRWNAYLFLNKFSNLTLVNEGFLSYLHLIKENISIYLVVFIKNESKGYKSAFNFIM